MQHIVLERAALLRSIEDLAETCRCGRPRGEPRRQQKAEQQREKGERERERERGAR